MLGAGSALICFIQLFDGQPDFLTFTGIGALLSGLAAVVAVVIALRQDRDAKILTFLKETDGEICRQLEIEEDVKDYEECLVYAYNYLDIMERIAFLYGIKKIPHSLADYYHVFFNYAVTIMGWYTSAYDDYHSPLESWPRLIEWFARHDMNPYVADHLPPIMRNILNDKKIQPDEILKKLAPVVNNERVRLHLKPMEAGGVYIKPRRQQSIKTPKSK